MIEAIIPINEADRLSAIRAMQILDTPAEEAFDRIVRMVERIFSVPIVQISLVDKHREWFKAKCGTEDTEGDRKVAFCTHTILSNEVMVVEDAAKDARFHDSPLVTDQGIRFYAGAPLRTQSGLNLGALCMKDYRPRKFSSTEAAILQEVAAITVDEMEHRLVAMRADAANEAKSQYLANMSHELRTPLNAIIGYSEMLLEDTEDLEEDTLTPDLRKIHGAAKHLLNLINDVLDLSKIEAGKIELHLETFAIKALLKEVTSTIRPLVEKNANALSVCTGDNVGTMHADLVRVRQILFNLVSNASKFTENGKIILAVTREAALDGKDWLGFRVSDTGIGMKPEQIKKIFKPFTQVDASTTRKYGGTGLGLTITKHFCEMMGGEIKVESESGKGTSFTVRLPAVVIDPKGECREMEEEQEIWPKTTQTEISPNAKPRTNATVLAIESDAKARDLIKQMLRDKGFRVVGASESEEGLRLARELHPDVITLDVVMPEKDGWTILSALKADPQLAEIPVVMLTMMDDRDMGYALGATDYLVKPVERNRLAEVLRKYQLNWKGKVVLLVEDDGTTRKMMRRMLEKAGWAVAEAENGRVGMEWMATHKPPDLILLDLMMPEMDGFEFMEALRSRGEWRRIPVVVVTSKDITREDRLRLHNFVVKIFQKGTYSREELLDQVQNLINAAPHRTRIPFSELHQNS